MVSLITRFHGPLGGARLWAPFPALGLCQGCSSRLAPRLHSCRKAGSPHATSTFCGHSGHWWACWGRQLSGAPTPPSPA